MDNIVIGFDIGVNQIAFAILDEKEHIIRYDMYWYEEPVLVNVMEKCLNIFDKYKPLVVGIEIPFGCNQKVLIDIAEVKAAIRAACQNREILCIDMTPTQAKAVTGVVSKARGKDLKKQTVDNVRSYYMTKYDVKLDEFITHHEADAINIALFTLNKSKKELSRLFV